MKKTLSPQAFKTIDAYLNFGKPGAQVSIPYFNNRRAKIRHGLRVLIGKGEIRDIEDEVTLCALRDTVKIENLQGTQLKELLVAHNIGIDCSGFAYYVLEAENIARGYGRLSSKLQFPFATSLRKRFITWLRPIENAGVSTLSHEQNSRQVPRIMDVRPGDFVSMINNDPASKQYNHLVVIDTVEYENDRVKTLHYSHSIAWPTDGEFNHGVRQGRIEIKDMNAPLTDQLWVENQKSGDENFTLARAKASATTMRRLKWWQ